MPVPQPSRQPARFLPLLLAAVLVGCAPLPPKPPPRQPVAPSLVPPDRIARLIARAEQEWIRWGSRIVLVPAGADPCALLPDGRCVEVADGCGQERTAQLCPVVDEYWAALPYVRLRHNCDRTDVCEAEWPIDAADPPAYAPPWSAAFISAMMRDAGLDYPAFLPAAAHADYVVAAREGHISAFDVLAVPARAEPGDLICAVRGAVELTPFELERIEDGRRATPMHCDIVVRVDLQRGVLEAIGGNVHQTVARSIVALDPLGRVSYDLNPRRRWVLVLRARRTWDWVPLTSDTIRPLH